MDFEYATTRIAEDNLKWGVVHAGAISASTIWRGSLVVITYSYLSNKIINIWSLFDLSVAEVEFLESLLNNLCQREFI